MKKGADLQNAAWQALTGAPLLFFHGLISRLRYVQLRTGERLYLMDESDPTTWLVHGVAIPVFVAVVRLRRVPWGTRLGTVLAGLIIVVTNWGIGSSWAVTASLLIA
jgi:hypothetical protein